MSEGLIAAIREVFPDAPPPGGPVVAHDCPECDDVGRLLQGRRWREVEAPLLLLRLVRAPDAGGPCVLPAGLPDRVAAQPGNAVGGRQRRLRPGERWREPRAVLRGPAG